MPLAETAENQDVKRPTLEKSVAVLAKELECQKPERLALLIRRTIKFLLSELPEGIRFKNEPEAISFLKRSTPNPAEFILDYFDGEEAFPSISIFYNDSTFRGMPKRNGRVTDLSQMPALVKRRRIYARGYRKYKDMRWHNIADEEGQKRIATDFEV
jgi:hypothetical protein